MKERARFRGRDPATQVARRATLIALACALCAACSAEKNEEREAPLAVVRPAMRFVVSGAASPDAAPTLGGDWTAVGSDLRPAVMLRSDRPLETDLEIDAGRRLAFAYGYTKAAPRCADALLVVTLTDANETKREHSTPLAAASAAEDAWHRIVIDVQGRPGERIRARFALESPSKRDCSCAVTLPEWISADAENSLVLLITSDTHRADHLGTASDTPVVDTPALDALARRGVTFTTCFSSTNVTVPSHASLFTARHPRDTRLVENAQALSEQAWTLSEVFRSAGFVTIAAVSAAHLDPRTSGLGQGFDRVSIPEFTQRRANEAVGDLRAWIAEYEHVPVFAWLHLYDAHTPYDPPKPFDRSYYPADKNPFDRAMARPSIDRKLLPRNMPQLRDLEYPLSQYRGEVAYLDSELAAMLSSPRELEGIVAFTADHGESFGEHGVWWDHGELYPETLHVPLILAYPGAPAGARVTTRVDHLDLGRTLLDLAGLAEREFPGRSLLDDLDQARAVPVYTISAGGHSASITSDRWHLILHLSTHAIDAARVQPFKQEHAVELYDLEQDPKTLNDLARVEHARARELRAALVHWLGQGARLDLYTEGARDEQALARLAELGYVSSESARGADDAWIDPTCACANCESYR